MVGAPALWHDLCARLAEISATFLDLQVRGRSRGGAAVRLLGGQPDGRGLPRSRAAALGVRAGPDRSTGGAADPLRRRHRRSCSARWAAPAPTWSGVDWRLPLAEAQPSARRAGTRCRATSIPALLGAPWPVLAERTRAVLRSGAEAPGHVFNLGHGVPPDTDPDVLERIVDLVHDGGRSASCAGRARRDPRRRRRRRHRGPGGGPAPARRRLRRDRAGGITAAAAARWPALGLDGIDLDVGAESMLARRPEAVALVRRARARRPSWCIPGRPSRPSVVGGRPHRLPTSAHGRAHGPRRRWPTCCPRTGWTRARQEPNPPAPPLTGDVAIGQLVDERFGPEVTDRLLEPLLGGVYAGRSRRAVVRRSRALSCTTGPGPADLCPPTPPPSIDRAADRCSRVWMVVSVGWPRRWPASWWPSAWISAPARWRVG